MSGSAGHTVGSCPSLVYGQVDLYPALATGHLATVPSVTEFLGPHGPEKRESGHEEVSASNAVLLACRNS